MFNIYQLVEAWEGGCYETGVGAFLCLYSIYEILQPVSSVFTTNHKNGFAQASHTENLKY